MAKATSKKTNKKEQIDSIEKKKTAAKKTAAKKLAKKVPETKSAAELFEEAIEMPEPSINPGPKNEELIKAAKPLVNPVTGEIDFRVKIEDLVKKAPKEGEQKAPGELSFQAKKWEIYLEYTKWTPEAFLETYPQHKFKEFIEEIIRFKCA